MTQYRDYFSQHWHEKLPKKVVDNVGNTILEISFPEPGKIRSRKVVTRSRARSTIKYPSWKMERMIQCESVNELNAIRFLDYDPDINAYCEQPLTIYFTLDNETHKHYPDVLVLTNEQLFLWEIKSYSDSIKPGYLKRTSFLESTLPKLGFTYQLILAEDLKKQPRLSNIVTILKHGRQSISEIEREQFRQFNLIHPIARWESELNNLFSNRGKTILARLTLEGILQFNIDQALSPQSEFTYSNSIDGRDRI